MSLEQHPHAGTGTSFLQSPYVAVTAPIVAVFYALALWLAFEPETVMRLVREGGPVERPTEIFWFMLAAAMWLWRRPEDHKWVWLALCIMFVAAGAREMDLHKAWTHDSMLKVSFYIREAPLMHKLVSFTVVLTVATAAVFLIRRYARRVWQGARRREPLATTVVIFIATMVVSKIFDRSINILAEDFGIPTPLSTKALVSALEEILELSLPFVAAIGFFQHRRAANRTTQIDAPASRRPTNGRTLGSTKGE